MTDLYTLQSLVQKLHTLGDKECLLQMEPAGITRWSAAEVAEAAQKLARGLLEIGVRTACQDP